MVKHYTIYTAKSGDRYIQTTNEYLAKGLAFCGFTYKVFTKNNSVSYSFLYSEELLKALDTIHEIRNKNN